MRFTFVHNNLNVLDLEKSLSFYEQALGLKETRRIEAEDKSFLIVFLGDGSTLHSWSLLGCGIGRKHIIWETMNFISPSRRMI